MREIKFRAWDTFCKSFCTPNVSDVTQNINNIDYDKYIFEQYTGLKDKNGTEIYEGDICKFNTKFGLPNHDYKVIVIWSDEMALFKIEKIDTTYVFTFNPFLHCWVKDQYEFEVIGNIHQQKQVNP